MGCRRRNVSCLWRSRSLNGRSRGASGARVAEGVTEAIIEATLTLAEEQGIDEVTIEAVAARANISRPTLYRRWSSKDALLEETLEVMVDRYRVDPDTGNVRDDLIDLFCVMIDRLEGPLRQLMDLSSR